MARKHALVTSSPTAFTFADAQRILSRQNDRKHACFQKVLEKALKQIEKAVRAMHLACVIEVPAFTFDGPVYELHECVSFVQNSLTNNGFTVNYYFPNVLFVSWVPPEKTKPQQAPASLALKGPATTRQKQVTCITKQVGSTPANPVVPRAPRKTKNTTFVKSITEFKPSGKFVLDIS